MKTATRLRFSPLRGFRRRRRLACWGLVPLLLAAGCAGRRLGRSQAREIVAEFPGINLTRDDVYVEGVTQLDSRHAVAEASVKTAFKMERSGDRWIVSEIRLDRDRWVPVDHVYQGLVEHQRERTREDLHLVALGLERFRLRDGSYPEPADFLQLMDQLFPALIPRMVAQDAWARPLLYQREDGRYRLTSLGPDGKLGTADDVVVTGGTE